MKVRTVTTSGKEVLFIGGERGNSRSADAWLSSGRWRISMPAIDLYLTEGLKARSFGTSIDRFVFCFEIANFEDWGAFFQASADYTSYKPKSKEIWSVGQIRWDDVKDLAASEQLQVLRTAIQTAINRIEIKKRKPKDFAHIAFASAVEALLESAPLDILTAKPAFDVAS
jgi:hypothetical protein